MLSFFDTSDDDQNQSLTGKAKTLPHTGDKKSQSHPSVVRPARVFKHRKPQDHPLLPAVSEIDTKNATRKKIKHYRQEMWDNFQNARDLLLDNPEWPGHYTFQNIEHFIGKVQEVLQPIWEQDSNHKTKIAAIHSMHINTDGWNLTKIYRQVSEFAINNGVENQLTLENPLAHSGEGPYAKVVLAWLFAAKKQLMRSLTVYMRDNAGDDPDADRFVYESEAGDAARATVKRLQKKLPRRSHHKQTFEDFDLLVQQYDKLHIHRDN